MRTDDDLSGPSFTMEQACDAFYGADVAEREGWGRTVAPRPRCSACGCLVTPSRFARWKHERQCPGERLLRFRERLAAWRTIQPGEVPW